MDGTSTTSEANYGSFRGRPEVQSSSALHSATASHREPTRSSVHLSYRGPIGMYFPCRCSLCPQANLTTVQVDNAQYARSVREDTAELASYALSDRASVRSISPLRHHSTQTQLESYFTQGPETESAINSEPEGLHHHTIQEVSEPVSPERSPSNHSHSPGTSALTSMLKRSPPNTLPKEGLRSQNGCLEGSTEADTDEDDIQRRLVMTANGVKIDSSERTPLLAKQRSVETHPDWIRGEQDVEGQLIRHQPSWPKLHNMVLWPKEKGIAVLCTIVNPKAWDRRAIFQHAVLEPAGCLPAVVLGALLNVLDALSYGTSNSPSAPR
jgi:SulP family sulfate permease